MRPSPAVLASFGADAGGAPVWLPGGGGTAWRAGEMVLKPAGNPRVARWTADLYLSLSGHQDPGFRVPRPLRSGTGDWIALDPATGASAGTPAEAWVAWQWLPGEPAAWAGRSPRWPQLTEASRAFHAALDGRPAPPWLGTDGSPWTVGDQVAWGERDPGSVLADAPGPLDGQLRGLLPALRPVRLPCQLIHGDLGGNVLFADGEPPAVIDFSPYWRPRRGTGQPASAGC
jgi:prepilin-type processing-associated H-X9-DG protein